MRNKRDRQVVNVGLFGGGGCSDSRTANYDITQLNICLYAMIQRFSSSSYWYTVHSLTLPFAEQAWAKWKTSVFTEESCIKRRFSHEYEGCFIKKRIKKMVIKVLCWYQRRGFRHISHTSVRILKKKFSEDKKIMTNLFN